MPRNGSGGYTLPEAPFVPGTTISSAAVNADLADIASALTGSVATDGQSAMSGQFKATAGTAGSPGISFASGTTNGFFLTGINQIGVAILGVAVGYFNSLGWSTASGAPIGVPIGTIVPYGGASATSGWLLCYGQNVSRTTYALLFAIIGTTFGAGDGINTFGIPDLRGRVPAGVDNMGGVAAGRLTTPMAPDGNTLSAVGGQQFITLTTSTMPSHTHTGSGSANSAANNVDHTHGYDTIPVQASLYSGGGISGRAPFSTTGATTGGESTTHQHLVIMNFTTDSTGSDGAHLNIQPTLLTNMIIFAGA